MNGCNDEADGLQNDALICILLQGTQPAIGICTNIKRTKIRSRPSCLVGAAGIETGAAPNPENPGRCGQWPPVAPQIP